MYGDAEDGEGQDQRDPREFAGDSGVREARGGDRADEEGAGADDVGKRDAIDRRTNQKTLVDVLEKKEKDFKETLDRLVDKLNTNFTVFMRNIHCQGAVELINRDSFSTIGLDIKVSFRSGQEVQSLNGMVQSGGVGVGRCDE